MTRATLRLEQVSRWYGDVLALNAVDLELTSGVTGLLGPNGAGKSTMIRLIVGLADPGDGRVTLDGRPIRNDLSALARIGYVADGDAIYEELTAERFLLDQARLRGFDRAAAVRRAEEVLVRVGLRDAMTRRIGGFSKGMRQRVKLAQAMLHDPDVLVLDEPLTGLDPVMRRDYTRVIRELGDEGVTILVSSHVLHEVEAMTNNVLLMHHGQLLAEGSVAEIRDLLETYARRIRLVTDDPRALAAELIGHTELVDAVTFEEAAVVVDTMRPNPFCRLVQELVVAGKARVIAIEPMDDDLGSVFKYLVNGATS